MEELDQQPPTSQIPTPEQKNHFNWLRTLTIGFGIVSIGIAIAVGGYVLGTKKSQPQVQTIVVSPTPTPDPTANWKTYTNTKVGYSVKYPANFFLKEHEFATTFSNEPQPAGGPGLSKTISIKISTNNANNDALNEEFDALFKAKEGDDVIEAHHAIDVKVTKLKNFKIGGYDVVGYIHDGVTPPQSGLGRGPVGYSHIIIVRRNDQIIELINTSNSPEETKQMDSIFDQILSTFKFTDQAGQSNLTPDQIFSEAASQLGLTRSQLTYFRIFGQDKIQYSFGSGTNFAYKSGKWQSAGGGQGIAICTELNNVPEQYRPICYDTAIGQEKYMDSQRQSLNYPPSQMTSYIGE